MVQLKTYERSLKEELLASIHRNPSTRRMIMFQGGRQAGKTTVIHQVLAHYKGPSQYLNLDFYEEEEALEEFPELEKYQPQSRRKMWMIHHWRRAREVAQQSSLPFVLVLDEIQRLENWTQKVKGRWDEDYWHSYNVQIILLGSSPHLLQKGLSEGMNGRFINLYNPHWSYSEMSDAFGFSLDEYLFYGGYPGAAEELQAGGLEAWRSYMTESVVEPNLNRDVFSLITVDEPEVFRQLYTKGAQQSGTVYGFDKIRKDLQGGRQSVLIRYLEIMDKVFMLATLPNYELGRRPFDSGSSDKRKFQVYNNALLNISHNDTLDEAKARNKGAHWGRVVESAVGAHLLNTKRSIDSVYYWRRNDKIEVDFVVTYNAAAVAIEVKSGSHKSLNQSHKGLEVFRDHFPECTHTYLIGQGGNVSLEEFLSKPASYWCSLSSPLALPEKV